MFGFFPFYSLGFLCLQIKLMHMTDTFTLDDTARHLKIDFFPLVNEHSLAKIHRYM